MILKKMHILKSLYVFFNVITTANSSECDNQHNQNTFHNNNKTENETCFNSRNSGNFMNHMQKPLEAKVIDYTTQSFLCKICSASLNEKNKSYVEFFSSMIIVLKELEKHDPFLLKIEKLKYMNLIGSYHIKETDNEVSLTKWKKTKSKDNIVEKIENKLSNEFEKNNNQLTDEEEYFLSFLAFVNNDETIKYFENRNFDSKMLLFNKIKNRSIAIRELRNLVKTLNITVNGYKDVIGMIFNELIVFKLEFENLFKIKMTKDLIENYIVDEFQMLDEKDKSDFLQLLDVILKNISKNCAV